MTSLGSPGLSSQSISGFSGHKKPKNPETDWDDKPGKPRLVIPVRFGFLLALFGQKTPKRTGMTSLESLLHRRQQATCSAPTVDTRHTNPTLAHSTTTHSLQHTTPKKLSCIQGGSQRPQASSRFPTHSRTTTYKTSLRLIRRLGVGFEDHRCAPCFDTFLSCQRHTLILQLNCLTPFYIFLQLHNYFSNPSNYPIIQSCI